METSDSAFARNVAALRSERKFTVRALSARLEELGRPMHPSGVTKLENGSRQPGPADLIALAIALGVSPVRLLLPVDDAAQEIALTPSVTATQAQAWEWALARSPLLAGLSDAELDSDVRVLLDDFRRRSLPADERLRDEHTAMRAARDVLKRIAAVLERQAVNESTPAGRRRSIEKWERNKPEGLRRDLARLVAEVEALIGADDGER